MSNHARNIKDLSIALEALTRVPDSNPLREQVDLLLTEEIDQLRKEQFPLKAAGNQDDEIPF